MIDFFLMSWFYFISLFKIKHIHMKTITYKDLEFQYKVDKDDYTHFYHGEELKYKYNVLGFKFGEVVSKPNPAFILDINIESPYYTQKEVIIEIKHGVKRWKRELQIKSGKII
jgi:hypothetical protein